MFVCGDAAPACDIALTVLESLENSASLPPARAGVAWGEVLSRDGDYFGPIVNLSARIVKAAEPGSVCAPETERRSLEAAGYTVLAAGSHLLKGIGSAVDLVAVTR